MKKILGSDDDDDDLDRPSPLLQTQRFTKSGTIGTKDFKTTQSRPKHNEVSNLNINLKGTNYDDEDSLNDSDDDTNTKTGRSTSSATTSQLTPKPKERSFLKKDNEKPKTKPRHIDIDDDERNPFGQSTMKPSPRHQILSIREEEHRDKTFVQGFSNEKKRQSPTDMFSIDHKTDFRRNSSKSSNDHDHSKHMDSDDETLSNKHSKPNDFRKGRHSPTGSDRSPTRKSSTRSKEEAEQSGSDDDHLHKETKRTSFAKPRQSAHDLVQTSPKDADSNIIQHHPSSGRPGSAGKIEVEYARRSSYCEDQDTVIPPLNNQKSPSRPTSAKSNTTRQQTQSVIDTVTSANTPAAHDPLTSNNEALAAALQPSSSPPPPPPRPSAKLPPKPKSRSQPTHHSTGGSHKKGKPQVPSRYKEITSRVDTGRTPVASMDLTRSIEREFNKAVKSQTLPRPQSARVRNHSANSNSSERQRRRRSSSAYEHVKPRVNTNLSINFDELNTSQMRAESSQSIKDTVYLEWAKTKEDQKKLEKEQLKRWKEEKTKGVDKSALERKIYQNAQNLERWRLEKDEEKKKKIQEELKLRREHEENKKREIQQKKKDAKDGFDDWKIKKDEDLQQKIEEERNKKTEIEKQQEAKQKKTFEAEKAYDKWMTKKSDKIKKTHETKKNVRDDQLKKVRENEETKFVSAQDAYEKWLKEKEKYEIEEKANTLRRNSVSNKQQQVPFLPGGSQRNTGKIYHAVW